MDLSEYKLCVSEVSSTNMEQLKAAFEKKTMEQLKAA